MVAARSGPVPAYCSRAHRQAAYRARAATRAGAAGGGPIPGELFDELAVAVGTPGDETHRTLWAIAADIVEAGGRSVPADIDIELRSTSRNGDPPRRRRASRWGGVRLPRPTEPTDWLYVRTWDDDWGMQVVVRALRGNRPRGAAKPLWLRRHRANESMNWRAEYDWTDEFGMPRSDRIYALGADLVADAVQLAGLTGGGRRYDPLPLQRRRVVATRRHELDPAPQRDPQLARPPRLSRTHHVTCLTSGPPAVE